MDYWKSHLKADPSDWLLEKENPSVRYFTLIDIAGKSPDDSCVVSARKEIMKRGAVPLILGRMNDEGYWEKPDTFYTSKYKGSVWQLVILSELGASGDDERIGKACELLLENSQDSESGGFSMHRSEKKGGGRHSEVIPCLTGNLVSSLFKLGYANDPRVKRGIDWIVRYQRFDDGEGESPAGWPSRRHRRRVSSPALRQFPISIPDWLTVCEYPCDRRVPPRINRRLDFEVP